MEHISTTSCSPARSRSTTATASESATPSFHTFSRWCPPPQIRSHSSRPRRRLAASSSARAALLRVASCVLVIHPPLAPLGATAPTGDTTMPDAVLGSLVDGRYKVVARLGAGGMADVYLAEDQQLGRKVALKLLYRRFAENPGFVERFRREAQAAAGLQHPNVVSVYDRGSYDGTYYIAMEYLPGRSLKQLIRAEAPLD